MVDYVGTGFKWAWVASSFVDARKQNDQDDVRRLQVLIM